MSKSLKELKQENINETQMFDHLREFVNQNMNSSVVQNAIHQAQVEDRKGLYNSSNNQNNQKAIKQ